MSRQEPMNTLQQDLMLLAKNHYKSNAFSQIEVAKRICAFHVLVETSFFRTRDVVFWLLKEFVETGLILNDPRKYTSFLLDHGKYQLYRELPSQEANRPYIERYFETMAGDLLSEISNLKVLKDDKWCMPFDKPEPDPYILDLINVTIRRADAAA